MKKNDSTSDNYQSVILKRCGNSGLVLPAVSLGLWHNFGSIDDFDNAAAIIKKAFDLGIFHFDLANNYGPEPGSAEENFGRIFAAELKDHRDELIISTKAGFRMWNGPFGDGGSRKSLISSCDQSLKRMGLDYVDIFYHHRPDPETPLEETMQALDFIVRSGRALYIGLSNYAPEDALRAFTILKELKTPVVIYQGRYNMLNRDNEKNGMFDMLCKIGLGGICFSPLAQGLLSDRYLFGIPEKSRAVRDGFLKKDTITPDLVEKISKLNAVAKRRSQSLSQMALAWLLSRPGVTSVLCGASSPEQLEENAQAPYRCAFSQDEYDEIDSIIFSRIKYSR